MYVVGDLCLDPDPHQAGTACGSSWGWKGILQGHSVLVAGLRWRVGNGDSIRVKEDPWLPVPYTFRTISHHVDMPIYVKDLIDLDTKQWRGDEGLPGALGDATITAALELHIEGLGLTCITNKQTFSDPVNVTI
ncbi:hypothetical protein L3X38_001712 [Prunus dulcis]|uniref:Uncharacterized protein n=1 Tax=Prunus dulcis TaxID=3755 RepID=A0AAD4WSM2_PRUDU|nr:hypothetical protein L3X38_001712 [Prunus dulcis]